MRTFASLVLLAAIVTVLGGNRPDIVAEPYPYEVHLPHGYSEYSDAGYPLILFLHGGGGLIPTDNPIPDFAGENPGFPFVVVTPIASGAWEVDRLATLLAEIQNLYRINPERIYGTGLSMGAVGIWAMAATDPALFAALALVAGQPDPAHACNLAHLPVQLFHNRADEIIPVDHSVQLAHSLEACGAHAVQLTIYEELEADLWHHNAWKAAYSDPELYDWFLKNRTTRAATLE